MKFRAYDPTTNKMYYPPNEHIYLNIDGACVNFQNGEVLEGMFETGFIAKDKFLIYCCDILRVDFLGNYTKIAEIIWCIEEGAFLAKFDDETAEHLANIGQSEIVGNTKQHKIEDFQ